VSIDPPDDQPAIDRHALVSAQTGSRIQRLSFDPNAVAAIAATLRSTADMAPFQLPGASVFQILVDGANDRPATLLTLWPSLRRVDVIGGSTAAVFTTVATVDLVEGVEVQFRRDTQEYLIVAIGGKIIIRA
jgi:hypothetical protein